MGQRFYPRLSTQDLYWYNYLWLSYEGGRHYVYPPAGMVDARRGRVARAVAIETEQGKRHRTEFTGGGCFLVAHERESAADFEIRRALSYPIEICAPVVQQYVGTVMGAQLTREGPPERDGDNADVDGRGASIDVAAREWLRNALVEGDYYVVTDNGENGRPYSWGCSPQHLLNWRLDSRGAFEAALIVEGAEEPAFAPMEDGSKRVKPYLRLRQWTPSEWQLWRCKPDYSDAELVERGPGFGFVPVVPIRYRDGRSLIAGLADIQHDIYNTLSWLRSIHRDQGFPVLAVPSEIGAGSIRNDRQIELSTKRALGYNGAAGIPSWLSPPTEQCREMREHIGWLALRAREQAGVARRQDSAQAASGISEEWRHNEYHALAAEAAEMMEAAETAIARQRIALMRGTTPEAVEKINTVYSTDYAPADPEKLAATLDAVIALGIGGTVDLEAKKDFVERFFSGRDAKTRRAMLDDLEQRAALAAKAERAIDERIVAERAMSPAPPPRFGNRASRVMEPST